MKCGSGIADGVGSWSERNIDPGLYSRMLMEKSKQAVLEIPLSEDVARQVLIQAHKQTNLMVRHDIPGEKWCL
jgi:hypothetical protein